MTRPRERWTEEEHRLFLEAVQLHGRAWKKIEGHIGTKTTVQIRSHAQKFFAKFERECPAGTLSGSESALANSPATSNPVPSMSVSTVSEAFQVPPPRHKRKPAHPYPRKNCPDVNSYSEDPKQNPFNNATCPGATSKQSIWTSNFETFQSGSQRRRYELAYSRQVSSSPTPSTNTYHPPASSRNVYTNDYSQEARCVSTEDSKICPIMFQAQRELQDSEHSLPSAAQHQPGGPNLRTKKEPQTSTQPLNMYSPELALSVLQQFGRVPAFAVAFEAAAAAALSVVMSGSVKGAAPNMSARRHEHPVESTTRRPETFMSSSQNMSQTSTRVLSGNRAPSASCSVVDAAHISTLSPHLGPWCKPFPRSPCVASTSSPRQQLEPGSSSSGMSYSTGPSRTRSRGSSPSLQTGGAMYGEQEDGSVDDPGQKKDRADGAASMISTLMSATQSVRQADHIHDPQVAPGGPNSCFARWKPKEFDFESTRISSSDSNDLELYKNYSADAKGYPKTLTPSTTQFSQDRIAAAAAVLELVRGAPSALGMKGQPVYWMHPWPGHPNKTESASR
eukprot:CAMPEP_0196582940 /NCGR_PEP_ID=MMETSP1081-20130531/41330_1 /TAXON_ID=36882 /ORGANISM="Pyramimonas amylifera, Strain CCMP720" /LENGTH=561 /DNA_ID=CAMNT_0041903667 /DNA_START=204 /DNA_END=1889 /DNA_ORIENTATION=+